MSQPRVTVLIDTYNYGQYVEQAVESALSQDLPSGQMEVLVVDDGSTDETAERVRKYGTKIQYLRKENGGQASALNFGFAKVRGEIVALLDADDYWLPGKLRRVLDEFDKHPEAGLVYHRLWDYDTKTGEQRPAPFERLSGSIPSSPKNVLLFNGMTTTGLAFRRSALQPLLPIPETLRLQADAYIATLATFVAPVVAVDEPLAVYRIHGGNLYFAAEGGGGANRLRRRMSARRVLAEALRSWFVAQGYDLKQPAVRATVRRWLLLSENDEFALSAPGRLRSFLHLLRYNRQHRPLMKRRLHLINYFNAFAALLIGYQNLPKLDRTRESVTRWIRAGLGAKRSTESATHEAEEKRLA